MTVRETLGNKLVAYGQATQEVVPEFEAAWDPNGNTAMAKVAEAAGRMMESFGRRILPGLPEMENE